MAMFFPLIVGSVVSMSVGYVLGSTFSTNSINETDNEQVTDIHKKTLISPEIIKQQIPFLDEIKLGHTLKHVEKTENADVSDSWIDELKIKLKQLRPQIEDELVL